jgi:hypothetical protein
MPSRGAIRTIILYNSSPRPLLVCQFAHLATLRHTPAIFDNRRFSESTGGSNRDVECPVLVGIGGGKVKKISNPRASGGHPHQSVRSI